MLLDMYWERMGLRVPIYVAAGMAQHATLYYRLFAQVWIASGRFWSLLVASGCF